MMKETFFTRSARAMCLILSVLGTTAALAQTADPPAPQPATPEAQPTAPTTQPETPAPPPAAAPQRAVEKNPAAAGRVVDRIVAVVNDEVITSNELQSRLRVAESQLERQNIALPARPVLIRQVLERMIIDRAQLQMARETGVRVDDATVNAAIARIAEQNVMSLPQFRERLDKEGITFSRFRDDVRD